MTENPIHRYGEIVMSTMGARALIDIGDASTALHVLRHSTANILREVPEADREAASRVISIALRTLDLWSKQAKQSKEEQEKRAASDEGGSPPAGGEELRFFWAVMSLLQQSGDEFISLGRIVDHVKATVNRRFNTEKVKKRLDAYVGLGRLQHAPEDDELYRLTVRIPEWVEPNQAFMGKLLSYILPIIHEVGYQNLVRAAGAEVRIQTYEIPTSQQNEFTQAVIREYRDFLERLDKLEEALQAVDPEAPRSRRALIFMTGHTLGQIPAEMVTSRSSLYEKTNS